MERTVIKRWVPSQSVTEITSLLHRAYAELASLGFEYVAATQCELTTRERLSEGIAFVAELDGKIVGTATLYLPPNDDSDCDWYRRDDVAFFGQFAVEPSLQRCGIGGRMMAEAFRSFEPVIGYCSGGEASDSYVRQAGISTSYDSELAGNELFQCCAQQAAVTVIGNAQNSF